MANEIIKGGGSHHISIHVGDYDKSEKFYLSLGLKKGLYWGEMGSRAAFYDLGDGSNIELVEGGSKEILPQGCFIHFAIKTTDCDSAYEAAMRAGAKSITPPESMEFDTKPYNQPVRLAVVEGPDGEVLEFNQYI